MKQRQTTEHFYNVKEVMAQPKADWDFKYLLMITVLEERRHLLGKKCLVTIIDHFNAYCVPSMDD